MPAGAAPARGQNDLFMIWAAPGPNAAGAAQFKKNAARISKA